MCGIAGLLFTSRSTNQNFDAEALVRRICRLQAHRGPDAEGVWADPGRRAVLGHRRLSVIDLDARSNQPMKSRDGRYVLSYNGEIYNYKTLREELTLTGTRFHTTSDTEVLLEGYSRWGNDLFSRLDGMFALAIFDTTNGKLVLARDRIGEKPLYYVIGEAFIAFSSEFRPLLGLPGVSYEISETSLYEYLSLRYIPAPNTLFRAIHAVQPGVACTIDADGSCSERAFFAFDLATGQASTDTASYLDELEEALVSSIRTRLIADVPLGAFLSSGIDSSIVCALAACRIGIGLNCFSAGFAGNEDETPLAERIADELGLPFTSYQISHDDLLSTVSHFGKYLDEPNGDRSCVPTLLLSQLMSQHVTVALSGDGGDELFCGYNRYLGLNNVPVDCRNPFGPLDDYFSRLLPVFPMQALDIAFPGQRLLFQRRFLSRFVPAIARSDLSQLDRLRLVDLHSYLPDAVLAKVDRMSMRHSLEVRTPFFNPDILALSQRLPNNLSVSGTTMKLALRGVLARYLPEQLIRSEKLGFGMPSSFMKLHWDFFLGLAKTADEALGEWPPLRNRIKTLSILQRASRANINSLWAWIALGQWVISNT